MTELLTAAQMRAIEMDAIDSGSVNGLELMERAGRGVVEAVLEEWPALATTSHRAAVLCGPGNNGGDGFVVARLLKERGWDVGVFLLGDPAKLPPDARKNCGRWQTMGGVGTLGDAVALDGSWDLVVDAIFGTGLTRGLEGDVVRLARHSADRTGLFAGAQVVAVDLPTGLCSDSGRGLGDNPVVFSADLTICFHAPKCGAYLDRGPQACGRLIVTDIGLDRKVTPMMARLAEPGNLGKAAGHKYSHGHALILTGGAGKGGAARLAARAALRIGAGLVTVGCPPAALQENAARLDAVMLKSVRGAEGLAEALQEARINALCVGPGLGLARAQALVPAALKAARAMVLDADALTAFADAPEQLFDMLHEDCVLTPHGGEFARLFPDIAEKLGEPARTGPAYSKVDATREAAERAGCTVLLKGPDTVIAAPDGRCAINSAHYDRAAPWLATAGSGDVLAGFITGLLARGFAPLDAASTAAWLHVECARRFGPGLIAEDLPETLPEVLRDLETPG